MSDPLCKERAPELYAQPWARSICPFTGTSGSRSRVSSSGFENWVRGFNVVHFTHNCTGRFDLAEVPNDWAICIKNEQRVQNNSFNCVTQLEKSHSMVYKWPVFVRSLLFTRCSLAVDTWRVPCNMRHAQLFRTHWTSCPQRRDFTWRHQAELRISCAAHVTSGGERERALRRHTNLCSLAQPMLNAISAMPDTDETEESFGAN